MIQNLYPKLFLIQITFSENALVMVSPSSAGSSHFGSSASGRSRGAAATPCDAMAAPWRRPGDAMTICVAKNFRSLDFRRSVTAASARLNAEIKNLEKEVEIDQHN